MEFTLESLKSLLHSWPTLAEQREKSSSTITELDYVDTPISYGEFFAKYIVANVPCVIGDWLTNSWLSTSSWYLEETDAIDWEHLLLHFGEFRSLTRSDPLYQRIILLKILILCLVCFVL